MSMTFYGILREKQLSWSTVDARVYVWLLMFGILSLAIHGCLILIATANDKQSSAAKRSDMRNRENWLSVAGDTTDNHPM